MPPVTRVWTPALWTCNQTYSSEYFQDSEEDKKTEDYSCNLKTTMSASLFSLHFLLPQGCQATTEFKPLQNKWASYPCWLQNKKTFFCSYFLITLDLITSTSDPDPEVLNSTEHRVNLGNWSFGQQRTSVHKKHQWCKAIDSTLSKLSFWDVTEIKLESQNNQYH